MGGGSRFSEDDDGGAASEDGMGKSFAEVGSVGCAVGSGKGSIELLGLDGGNGEMELKAGELGNE